MANKWVAPSLLSADFANLEKELKALHLAGADLVHVDVMDGHFVPNLTIGPPVVSSLKKVSPLPLDVHLMIEKPEKYLEAFLKAGSDYLTIHVESTDRVAACLREIRTARAKAGITLRPGTPIEKIEKYLELCDLVLVMTVEPGFGGQSFMMDQVKKIQWLSEKRKALNLNFKIEVDGGVSDKTRQYLESADILVSGNFIFKHPEGYQTAIEQLKI
ncbi:MAG: ribulose-phosphate 3-epimerase [Bdellovibrionales bacterium]